LKKELKVGLFAVIIIALAVWGFNYLKGKDLLNQQRDFYGIYNHVDGLESGQKIVINGFKVGRVDDIQFVPGGNGSLIVHMVLNNDFEVAKNTLAVIKSDGLLGTKMIALELGKSKELAQEGDTLVTSIEGSLTDEVNKQVLPIKIKAEKMLSSIDTVLIYIQNMLNQDTRDNVSESMERINGTFKKLENIITNLDVMVATDLKSMVSNVDSITSVIRANATEIDKTLAGFAELGDAMEGAELTAMFASVQTTIGNADSIIAKINRGEGTVGKLINDPAMYDNLNDASAELEKLLGDMKQSPERYVHFSLFGRKHKPYIAPEN
jgi:phospholipid/cholesterol/gamma-HCH transport system substrate-binding protein